MEGSGCSTEAKKVWGKEQGRGERTGSINRTLDINGMHNETRTMLTYVFSNHIPSRVCEDKNTAQPALVEYAWRN